MAAPDIILSSPPGGGDLEHQIFICALDVQKNLGVESHENAFRECFAFELERRKIPFSSRTELLNRTNAEESLSGFRVDFLVDGRIVVEIRSRTNLHSILLEQYRSYLRLSKLPLAILINFKADPQGFMTRITP